MAGIQVIQVEEKANPESKTRVEWNFTLPDQILCIYYENMIGSFEDLSLQIKVHDKIKLRRIILDDLIWKRACILDIKAAIQP